MPPPKPNFRILAIRTALLHPLCFYPPANCRVRTPRESYEEQSTAQPI